MSVIGWIYVIGFLASAVVLCGMPTGGKERSRFEKSADALVSVILALVWPVVLTFGAWTLYDISRDRKRRAEAADIEPGTAP